MNDWIGILDGFTNDSLGVEIEFDKAIASEQAVQNRDHGENHQATVQREHQRGYPSETRGPRGSSWEVVAAPPPLESVEHESGGDPRRDGNEEAYRCLPSHPVGGGGGEGGVEGQDQFGVSSRHLV